MDHKLEMQKALVKLLVIDVELICQGYCGILIQDR